MSKHDDALALQAVEKLGELRAEIYRLQDNLRTIASGELESLEECMSFANTCERASRNSYSGQGSANG